MLICIPSNTRKCRRIKLYSESAPADQPPECWELLVVATPPSRHRQTEVSTLVALATMVSIKHLQWLHRCSLSTVHTKKINCKALYYMWIYIERDKAHMQSLTGCNSRGWVAGEGPVEWPKLLGFTLYMAWGGIPGTGGAPNLCVMHMWIYST